MNRRIITRPLKAPGESITSEQLATLVFPLYGSPKLDGIRCVQCGTPRTASMKLFGNKFVHQELSDLKLIGLDGELIVGEPNDPNAFNNTSGPIRRYESNPDFRYYVFDNFLFGNETYKDRWLDYKHTIENLHPRVVVLEQMPLAGIQDVIDYEKFCIDRGYEGAMIRTPGTLYKQGRATLREGIIFKRKPFADAEALVIGMEEEMQNNNELVEDEMGLSKRASNVENKTGKNTLGNFILKSDLWEKSFSCGTGIGLTAELRKEVWSNKDKYMGRVVVFKYQKYGSIDRPRMPVYKGFRDEWDMTEKV